MNRYHEFTVVLMVLGSLLLGVGRLWPRSLKTVPPCERPVQIVAPQRTAVVCVAKNATVGRALRLFGSRCQGVINAAKRVAAGDRLLLGPRCEVVVARMAASSQLVLGLKLDLNCVSAQDLQALPRIGPVLSGRIVSFRQTHGPFARVADLKRVRGIGPVTVSRLKEFVCVGGACGVDGPRPRSQTESESGSAD